MPLKLMKEAFLLFGHEQGKFAIVVEGQLELYAADIGVDNMRPDEQCAVHKPCAARGIAQVVNGENPCLHLSYAELDIIGCVFISKGQRTVIFIDINTEILKSEALVCTWKELPLISEKIFGGAALSNGFIARAACVS